MPVRGGQCALHPHAVAGEAEGFEESGGLLAKGEWQVTLGYRYLHSDRHFSGDRENKLRKPLGTEVINDSHFFDLGVQYGLSRRYSVGLNLPVVHSERSAPYEHAGVRRSTYATGVGDIRLTAYGWLLNPANRPKGNVLFGLGIKFPTGEYDANDTFVTNGVPVVGTVDQSIQPGDGGYGFTTELLAFREFLPRTAGYFQGFYLFNPENMNGASTTTGARRGNSFEGVMSIPDQYLLRSGLFYALVPKWGFGVSAGVRWEGIPVEDVLGDSDGFRRPGFVFSFEPGLNWMRAKWNVNLTAPVAFYRNRERSLADIRESVRLGRRVHGDAAFADWALTLGITRKL